MSSVEVEPIRGLPSELPEGERILWQGEPRFATLARRAFHLRSIAIYFTLLIVARGLFAYADGRSPGGAFFLALVVVPLAGLGLGLIALMAWAHARTTVYTITNRRVVLRYGVAIPMTVNIPFTIIKDAALKTYANGEGDIPLLLSGDDHIAYLHLWPHARPWQYKQPQPMLRAIPDAASVASTLAFAITAAHGGLVTQPDVSTERPSEPASVQSDSAPSIGHERAYG